MRGANETKTAHARRLRKHSTAAERKLWRYLRSRSLVGLKFVRQEPIGRYIVDFVCREKRLVIEVDFVAASSSTPPHPDPLPARGEREVPSRTVRIGTRRTWPPKSPTTHVEVALKKMLRGEVRTVDALGVNTPSPRTRGEGGVRGPRRMRAANVTKTALARRLRKHSTAAERKLWRYLRSRSLVGLKFVRQEPIGPYIVDFVCREKRLVIEVDGGQHAENAADTARDRWLAEHRYRVLRFWNNEVLENIEGVWDTIFAAAHAATPPHPDPLPARGERESPSRTAKSNRTEDQAGPQNDSGPAE